MKHYLFNLVGFVLCLSCSSNSFGVDYYVSKSFGSDDNVGTTISKPWKSIDKVNKTNFMPGDKILFNRGDVWREQFALKSSGIKDNPIYVGAYGSGENPLIMRTNNFNDWKLVVNQNGVKVWSGKLEGVKNSWGAMRFGKRIPRYLGYASSSSKWGAPTDLSKMLNGFFYAPLNGWKFYIRNDDGNPGDVEIGAREHGIYLENISYVTIDGIDITGPGGLDVSGASSTARQYIAKYCDHIILKNCTLSYNNTYSAVIWTDSTNCGYENIKSYGHMSTGLYMISAGSGNYVKDCEVYECGTLITDYGDQGCIGILRTKNASVEKCYVHDNGYKGVDQIDACISVVVSPYCSVSRCYVQNAAGRGIMFAENSDYCTASYNIIENWGVFGKGITVWPSTNGIRIGGGGSSSTSKGCKILNNLFINGGNTPGEFAALMVTYNAAPDLQIKNNIFYNNNDIYDIFSQTVDSSGWIIANNVFFKENGYAIKFNNNKYDYNHIIGNTSGFFSYDKKNTVENCIIEDPKLFISTERIYLKDDSPCIDQGIDVGLYKDYYGDIVPSGDFPDIGPFEHSHGNVIEAPRGLIIE